MKKKICICFILLILIFILLIMFSQTKKLNMDSNNRIIVETGDDLKEILNGTQIGIAIQNTNKEDLEKNKKQFETASNSVARYSRSIETKIETNSIYTNEINNKASNVQLSDDELNYENILKKYFGEESINQIFSDIQNETSNNTGEYVFPESGYILLNKSIEIMNKPEATEEEKRIVREILESMDLSFVIDNDIVNILNNLNIDLDK